MLDPTEPSTLAGVMDELRRRGFTEHFTPGDGNLRAVESGKTLGPHEVVIAEFHRFEGISDPDDMAILYALEAKSGMRGTLVDAFGVYSDPRVSALMKDIRMRPDPPVTRRDDRSGGSPPGSR